MQIYILFGKDKCDIRLSTYSALSPDIIHGSASIGCSNTRFIILAVYDVYHAVVVHDSNTTFQKSMDLFDAFISKLEEDSSFDSASNLDNENRFYCDHSIGDEYVLLSCWSYQTFLRFRQPVSP